MSNLKNDYVIGIDIGHHGAIVIQRNSAPHIVTLVMPMIKTEVDYHQLYELIKTYAVGTGLVVFEKLGVIFGSSKATALSMGYQSGAVEMACIALGLPYVKVPPKEWQKVMFTGVDEILKVTKKGHSRDTKAMALIAAKRRFPGVCLTVGRENNKPHDGIVDALLLSEYAKSL